MKMVSLMQKLDNYILCAIKKYVQNKYLDILMSDGCIGNFDAFYQIIVWRG